MRILKSFLKNKNSSWISACAIAAVVCICIGLLSQTVQAETTYIIKDGDQVITHVTRTSDPSAVLLEAGFTLDSDDTYTTQATESGSQIIVQRAKQVTLCNEGQETVLLGYDETVEELLNHNGIFLGEDSQLSVSQDTSIYDGMVITLDHVSHRQETYTLELPYGTTYTYDDTMKPGETKVLSEGVPGQVQCKANVVYKNAQEQERTVVEETVLSEPVDQLIAVGTDGRKKEAKPQISDGKIVLPSGDVLTYNRTAQFVATAYTHTDEGCDMYTATGSRVRTGVVAVDPTVIPYGTRMFIVTNDGSYIYGLSTAEDCGGAIKGNRLDLYFETTEECFQFGVKNCTVYFLGDANWR